MSVSYDVFTGAFLNKVTEYKLQAMFDADAEAVIDGYMKKACASFRHVCLYPITDWNDTTRTIAGDIPDEDLEEIADIVSEGMVTQWLKPYVYNAENLENVLNTKDYESYSPAELAYRVKETYQTARNGFKSMVNGYSYDHGDLTVLHI